MHEGGNPQYKFYHSGPVSLDQIGGGGGGESEGERGREGERERER